MGSELDFSETSPAASLAADGFCCSKPAAQIRSLGLAFVSAHVRAGVLAGVGAGSQDMMPELLRPVISSLVRVHIPSTRKKGKEKK